jgi:glutamyl-tRNA reductase
MAGTRISDHLHQQLQVIRAELLRELGSEAPALQDMVNVAIARFIESWQTEERQEILKALLESREKARSRMGQRD